MFYNISSLASGAVNYGMSMAMEAGLKDPRVGKIIAGVGLVGGGVSMVASSGLPQKVKALLTKEASPAEPTRWGRAGLGMAAIACGTYSIASGVMEFMNPEAAKKVDFSDNGPVHPAPTPPRIEMTEVESTVRKNLLAELEVDTNDLCQIPSLEYICEGNLDISRENMPQVEGSVKDEFLGILSNVTTFIRKKASSLTATQKEMNYYKIKGMVQAAVEGKFNPCDREIIVVEAPDGKSWVVDGHHTYAACRILNGDQKVANIMGSVRDILMMLDTLPGVTKVGL